jgi:hypothetical protein
LIARAQSLAVTRWLPPDTFRFGPERDMSLPDHIIAGRRPITGPTDVLQSLSALPSRNAGIAASPGITSPQAAVNLELAVAAIHTAVYARNAYRTMSRCAGRWLRHGEARAVREIPAVAAEILRRTRR